MPADCCKKFYAKIPDDEPVFTLAGRDTLATEALSYWIALARARGVNPDKISSALEHMTAMVAFQADHPERVHLPD